MVSVQISITLGILISLMGSSQAILDCNIFAATVAYPTNPLWEQIVYELNPGGECQVQSPNEDFKIEYLSS